VRDASHSPQFGLACGWCKPSEDTLERRKLQARDSVNSCAPHNLTVANPRNVPFRPLFDSWAGLPPSFKMRLLAIGAAVLSLASTALCTEKGNLTKPLTSRLILPSTFKPPQNFKNVNLVHIINLEKSYPKEQINVVIENIASTPQDEYFIPFTSQQMATIGGLEVKDKKNLDGGLFEVGAVEFDPERYEHRGSMLPEFITYTSPSDTQFYRVRLDKQLAPKAQQTLGMTFSYLSALHPLPKHIGQQETQFLVYEFSAYCPSSYITLKQKTEVKFPSGNVPEYTIIPGGEAESPQKAGSKFTYGSFGEVPAGAVEPVKVRYEFTKPLIHVSRLERDIEISHWGGNIAFEERYTLHNHAANLTNQFSRVQWASQQYYNPASTAIKELKFPLKVGSLDPYFTDVIGNVSTSRFRSNKREANLEIKPRYPIFGGWNYPFRVGWNADLKKFLRKLSTGQGYVLNVPFLEGPKQSEGMVYEHIELRVILPEGAEYVPSSSHRITTNIA
jgi:oligosaccharyltransferase complex subunit alpha (ribophorin I)